MKGMQQNSPCCSFLFVKREEKSPLLFRSFYPLEERRGEGGLGQKMVDHG